MHFPSSKLTIQALLPHFISYFLIFPLFPKPLFLVVSPFFSSFLHEYPISFDLSLHHEEFSWRKESSHHEGSLYCKKFLCPKDLQDTLPLPVSRRFVTGTTLPIIERHLADPLLCIKRRLLTERSPWSLPFM